MKTEEAAESFPWPWRGAAARRATLLTVAWVVALNVWALLAVRIPPLVRPSPWDEATNRRAPLYARLDSGWYEGIIRLGYGAPPAPGQPSAHAFFPLYPMSARLLHLATRMDSFVAGLVVSYAALLFAVPLFLEEARRRLGETRAFQGLAFLLLYPVGFFLAAVYTESLYLLVVLLAFREVRLDRPFRAIFFGLLAGLTRAPAAALAPALGLAWFLSRFGTRRRWALAVGAAPLLGVGAFILGIGLANGEPGLFFRSMGAWRHALEASAGSGPASFVAEAVAQWKTGHFFRHPGALAPYVHFLLFSWVGAVQLARGRFPDAAWTLALLALSVLTGTAAGVPRYTLTVFPGILLLAETLGARPLAGRLFLAATTFLLLLNAAFFVNWHFVS